MSSADQKQAQMSNPGATPEQRFQAANEFAGHQEAARTQGRWASEHGQAAQRHSGHQNSVRMSQTGVDAGLKGSFGMTAADQQYQSDQANNEEKQNDAASELYDRRAQAMGELSASMKQTVQAAIEAAKTVSQSNQQLNENLVQRT
jgi:hypothetical protein